MIEIDGSQGEGGGQILRTALSLSCLFRKPFRIFNIRKGRKKPGLMPQHLACVRAMQLITGAEVSGDFTGSAEIIFKPGNIRMHDIVFDIGTAGSTSLLLQAMLPVLAMSSKTSKIRLKGGTHVPFSPSFEYINNTFVYFLKKIGVNIYLTIDSYGFYPRGGGQISAVITPCKTLKPLRITKRGQIQKISGISASANLPLSIAERQKEAAINRLVTIQNKYEFSIDINVINVSSHGQGTYIYLQVESENSVAGFTALGERGKRAEVVGIEVVEDMINYVETGAALDRHISDQIIIYLSICKERSEIDVSDITTHLVTNFNIIKMFNDFEYIIKGESGRPGRIWIN